MIVRRWTGEVKPDREAAYLAFLRTEILPEMATLVGHRGTRVLRGDGGTIVVESYWEDLDAVRRFAGEDPGHAVVPAPAQELLARYDPRAEHYEVLLSD